MERPLHLRGITLSRTSSSSSRRPSEEETAMVRSFLKVLPWKACHRGSGAMTGAIVSVKEPLTPLTLLAPTLLRPQILQRQPGC